jgi:D-beta-D-heptose 7-phosphate kinase/D-beta-D-heptose 1-phosphate adenosyltransferase
MPELISSFQACRVLVIGDAILDEYLSGDCSRLSPEAPVPVLRVSAMRRVLGGAGNTAANVASLGGQARLIALVGTDEYGRAVSELLGQAGVAFEPVLGDRATLRKTRVVGQNQQLVRLDYEDLTAPDPSTLSKASESFERYVTECDIVVLSDYAKGFLTSGFCQDVIGRAHRCGKQVVVDPRPQHRDFYLGCDYLTPNWKESLGLLGRGEIAPTKDHIMETGRALVEAFGAGILLTLGPHGMAFFGRDGVEHFSVPTVAKEVFDVSGAGDTVVAAFALGRAAGAAHADAVAVANRAAGIAVGKFGTATVSAHELASDEAGGRVVRREELTGLAATLRGKGKRIVTVNGAFDLLHCGHLHVLREAKRQGDVLIVGLNSDASVRRYKGARRPIVPESQRAEMLLALRDVDYVHVFEEADPIAFIEQVAPDVHVNSAEYGENCVEAATVARLQGRLHLVGRIPGFSTTHFVEQLSS